MAEIFFVLGAGFGADDDGHFVNEGSVEGCAQANGLGENGCGAGGNSVQGFRPPVIGGDFQARDGGGLVDNLGGLFFEGHAGDQVVYALVGGEGGIQVGGIVFFRGLLSGR